MTKRDRIAIVWFASGDWSHGHSLTLRRRLQIARRFPRKTYYWLLNRLTRRLSGSDVAHCGVGYGGIVLDPTISGDRAWYLADFRRRYPTILHVAYVRLDCELPANWFCGRAYPRHAWPSLLRWLTGGRTRADNCVTATMQVLEFGGLEFPREIVSALDLSIWLEARYHADIRSADEFCIRPPTAPPASRDGSRTAEVAGREGRSAGVD